ncbi:MAG: nitroreductase family protein, partial [Hyphomonadaceae bacterium]
MKTTSETHVPLTSFREYPLDEMQARAVAFHEDLQRRRSVREFADRDVPREVIEACVSAAGTAPSGANHQPWFFACISKPEMKRQIREAAEEEERAFYDGRAGEVWLDALEPLGTDADKPHLEDAAWLIIIFAQKRGGTRAGEEKKNYYINESVGIATGLLLAACHT